LQVVIALRLVRMESPAWLERLGLHRPELRAWAMYDWANSAFVTTIVSAVFPIYYSQVAAAAFQPEVATRQFAMATTVSLFLVALLAPVLGALADIVPVKKKLLAAFLALGAAATGGMFFIQSGDWRSALCLFVLADVGACGSFIFYDALLRHIACKQEIDRVSASGYALGYVGGGLLLALNLAWIERPQWFGLPAGENLSDAQATLPARLAFVSVAVWWLAFSVPLFIKVREPAGPAAGGGLARWRLWYEAALTLRRSAAGLGRHRNALLMLAAFLLYNDGIGTIIRLAAIYGAELGLARGLLLGSILVVQFVGIPCSILFGQLAGRLGAKRAVFMGLCVYAGIAVWACFLRNSTEFFILAVLVGMVQGGTQALSRSLFASLIPRRQSTQFFTLFSLGEKFAGMLGPALFAAMVYVTGSSRAGILSIVLFFIAGGCLLWHVDVEEGRRAAGEAANP
jgi:UMF1 family MFS transporter